MQESPASSVSHCRKHSTRLFKICLSTIIVPQSEFCRIVVASGHLELPMPKSAITISLVPEAKGGPFLFWDDVAIACKEAVRIGFDAVEIFAPDGDAIRNLPIEAIFDSSPLQIAAFGTGAGMVKHGLSLSHPDSLHRQRAQQFVQSIMTAAARWQTPVIIGSMQGRWNADCDRAQSLSNLRESLKLLGGVADGLGIEIMLEPLNRYESNLLNTLSDGIAIIESLGMKSIKLLSDLFHANIEESNMGAAILDALPHIGHIHLADSNRHAAGFGHIDFRAIAKSLSEGGYDRYLSAEALPLPDSTAAAEMTFSTYRKFFLETS